MKESERLEKQKRLDAVREEAKGLREEIDENKKKTPLADQSSPEFTKGLQAAQDRLAALDQEASVLAPQLLVPSNAETPPAAFHTSDPPTASSAVAGTPVADTVRAGDLPKKLEVDPDREEGEEGASKGEGFRVKEGTDEPADPAAPAALPPQPMKSSSSKETTDGNFIK